MSDDSPPDANPDWARRDTYVASVVLDDDIDADTVDEVERLLGELIDEGIFVESDDGNWIRVERARGEAFVDRHRHLLGEEGS